MEPPPTRYRVVERGRRLEVIDTWKAAPRAPRADAPAPADGTSFVTRRWYDSKAPRPIRLDYATRARIGNLGTGIAVATAIAVALLFLLWPFSLAIPLLLTSPQVRAGLRGVGTGWIDSLDQAASDPRVG